MHYVTQTAQGTVVRTIINTDAISADGYQEFKPDDLFFGKRAADLKEGIYDLDGNYVAPLDEAVA